MARTDEFVDIHCHLVPEIDDGAKSWDETFAMAKMAVDDGITTIVVTPHQLGNYAHNTGDVIRHRTSVLQQQLDRKGIQLQVLPGADVRIEDDMVEGLRRGDVLSLGDHRKHVLLELPHELYFPLEPVLEDLNRIGMTGILSHPERNQGLLKRSEIVESLVEMGCLMQITAGSLIGGMGSGPQEMCEWMFEQRLVHFVATDAHGPKSRRPLIWRAFERVIELTDRDTAVAVCCDNPGRVADGKPVVAARRRSKAKRSVISDWFTWRKAG